MPQRLPPKLDIFLVCETIREEVGGKASLLGVFSGARLLVPSDTRFPTAINLALFGVFHDGEGAFRTKVRIFDPDGTEMVNGELPDLSKEANKAAQVRVLLGVFPVTKPGVFKVEFMLNGRPYHETFTVALDDGTA
jgi:hypothetical protein